MRRLCALIHQWRHQIVAALAVMAAAFALTAAVSTPAAKGIGYPVAFLVVVGLTLLEFSARGAR